MRAHPSNLRICQLLAALTFCAPAALRAQTYTVPTSATFSNQQAWNFGLGPVPASNPAGELFLQTFGSSLLTATNDLSLTLATLTLQNNSTSQLTVASALGGNFAFAGNAQILVS